MDTNVKIVCNKCVYFFITWEPRTPNGCKFHGFKSKEMPSMVVYKSSGMPCQGFTPKNSPK